MLGRSTPTPRPHTGQIDAADERKARIIWPELNANATKVVWSENLSWPHEVDWVRYYLGQWALHVADITPTGELANESTYSDRTDPGSLESYGRLGDRVMFSSDQGRAVDHAGAGHA